MKSNNIFWDFKATLLKSYIFIFEVLVFNVFDFNILSWYCIFYMIVFYEEKNLSIPPFLTQILTLYRISQLIYKLKVFENVI